MYGSTSLSMVRLGDTSTKTVPFVHRIVCLVKPRGERKAHWHNCFTRVHCAQETTLLYALVHPRSSSSSGPLGFDGFDAQCHCVLNQFISDLGTSLCAIGCVWRSQIRFLYLLCLTALFFSYALFNRKIQNNNWH